MLGFNFFEILVFGLAYFGAGKQIFWQLLVTCEIFFEEKGLLTSFPNMPAFYWQGIVLEIIIRKIGNISGKTLQLFWELYFMESIYFETGYVNLRLSLGS